MSSSISNPIFKIPVFVGLVIGIFVFVTPLIPMTGLFSHGHLILVYFLLAPIIGRVLVRRKVDKIEYKDVLLISLFLAIGCILVYTLISLIYNLKYLSGEYLVDLILYSFQLFIGMSLVNFILGSLLHLKKGWIVISILFLIIVTGVVLYSFVLKDQDEKAIQEAERQGQELQE